MEFTDYHAASLPDVVATYLDAHDDKQHAATLATLAPDAVVVDDGHTYRGHDEISNWLNRATAEYTYTSTRIGQQVDGARAVVQIRLDGNFPGNTVVLRYQFDIRDGQITRLAIEP